MAYSENWNLADVFTVAQAAYLWSDLDPPDNPFIESSAGRRPPEVAAIAQVMLGAIEVGQLTATWKYPSLKYRKDYFEVSVTRESLIKFAKA